jgi:hypothetical protein
MPNNLHLFQDTARLTTGFPGGEKRTESATFSSRGYLPDEGIYMASEAHATPICIETPV